MARCGHMAGPRKPTWMPTWHEKLYWTVGIKSRGWTADITRSGIRVMGHDPTDYAQSDG